MTDLKLKQKQFWRHFEELLFESGMIIKAGRAKPQNSYDVLFSDTGVMISNTIDTGKCLLNSRFYIRNTMDVGARGALILEQLVKNKRSINKLLNPQVLNWDIVPGDDVQTIGARLPIDFLNTQHWPVYLGWLMYMNSKLSTAYNLYLSR